MKRKEEKVLWTKDAERFIYRGAAEKRASVLAWLRQPQHVTWTGDTANTVPQLLQVEYRLGYSHQHTTALLTK